jgi:hypothetical protein
MARSRDEIRAERKQFVREHDGRFVEQASASVDLLAGNAKARAAGALVDLVANPAMDGNLRLALPSDPQSEPLARVALLFVLQSDAFKEWLSENVMEIVAGFATDMPLRDYQRRLDELEAELAETEREDRRRPLLEQKAELDEQLAGLE